MFAIESVPSLTPSQTTRGMPDEGNAPSPPRPRLNEGNGKRLSRAANTAAARRLGQLAEEPQCDVQVFGRNPANHQRVRQHPRGCVGNRGCPASNPLVDLQPNEKAHSFTMKRDGSTVLVIRVIWVLRSGFTFYVLRFRSQVRFTFQVQSKVRAVTEPNLKRKTRRTP